MNSISSELLFAILGLLVLLSAFFSGSETALMRLNRYKLKHQVKSGHQGAILASWLLERPDRLIGLILIFNNFVNILASAIATILGLRLFGEPGIAIATGLLTFVILVFSEVTPKTFAVTYPERLAFFAAYILKPLLKLSYPLVIIINLISNNLLKLFNVKQIDEEEGVSREELRGIVDSTSNVLPKKHQTMLLGIIDLEVATVEDIMIPRHEIVAINIDDEWESIRKQLLKSLHTRIPFYQEDKDKIMGIVHLKKCLPVLTKEDATLKDLIKVIRKPYFIPETTSLLKQLTNFQKNNNRVGFVVDEYGDIQGMVTLEDILEEVVGEFTTDPAQILNKDIHPQSDDSYVIDASINIRELNRLLKLELPTDGAKTLNGLIIEYLETMPESGTSVMIDRYPIEIIKTKNNSIRKVRISKRIAETKIDE